MINCEARIFVGWIDEHTRRYVRLKKEFELPFVPNEKTILGDTHDSGIYDIKYVYYIISTGICHIRLKSDDTLTSVVSPEKFAMYLQKKYLDRGWELEK